MAAKDRYWQHWYDKRLLLAVINSLLVSIKADSSERSLLIVFVPQESAAGYDGSVVQQEITTGRDQVAVGRDQDRWQREITTGYVEGGWQREIAAGNVMQ
ncbi:hypothetical protein B296_00021225 [Ensete ventricosum]|uniref:Uncharacterized protein n=1 Tax=Ensete ventricosum TaxID=4639 RepID=A0A426XVG2_ENSVE|nr:hypothetical protein B296_00021225 [Ensete ventricosum]